MQYYDKQKKNNISSPMLTFASITSIDSKGFDI